MSSRLHSVDKISGVQRREHGVTDRSDEDEGRAVAEREWYDSRPNWTPEWRIVAMLVREIQLGRVQRLAPAASLRTSPARLRDPGQSISRAGRDLESDRCVAADRPLSLSSPLRPARFSAVSRYYARGPWNIDNHAPTACKGLTEWCTTSTNRSEGVPPDSVEKIARSRAGTSPLFQAALSTVAPARNWASRQN